MRRRIMSLIQFSDCFIRPYDRVPILRMKRQLPGQELFDIEGVFLVRIGCQMIIRMLDKIIFLGKKRPYAPQLQDAFAAVQHRKFIHG